MREKGNTVQIVAMNIQYSGWSAKWKQSNQEVRYKLTTIYEILLCSIYYTNVVKCLTHSSDDWDYDTHWLAWICEYMHCLCNLISIIKSVSYYLYAEG